MTTIKELSDKLGVSKTAITKYVKEELGLKTEPRKALQLSAHQCAVVADHFSGDKLGKVAETENQGVQTGVQFCADEVASLQLELAVAKSEIAALERENELLRDRLQKADEALEREQLQSRGFWSRLGQKLLGSGRE